MMTRTENDLNVSNTAVAPFDGEAAAEETSFLALVRAGDERALEAFVRGHIGRMLAVARRFFRQEHDCTDAVQDAFLSAFRSLDQFQGHATLGTWLHRIVVNACLMKLRRQRRTRTVPLDDLLPDFDESGRHERPLRPWDDQAHNRLARAETRAQVRACIDRLPEPYREIILLRDIEELDTDETARLLGISPGAVKTRLHRARQALRTLLEPLFSWDRR
jgi:RNA polymerase sigma-70 factor (ECF subfamily)